MHDPLVVGMAERLGRLDPQPGDGLEISAAADGGVVFGGKRRARVLGSEAALVIVVRREHCEPPGQQVQSQRTQAAPRSRAILGRHGAAIDEPAELADQVGQASPLDKLHCVIRDVGDDSHGVDRHDVRMLEQTGDLGLKLESLNRSWIGRRGERQDLECHAPGDRDLTGLVNDAHATTADLADDAEITENALAVARLGRRRTASFRRSRCFGLSRPGPERPRPGGERLRPDPDEANDRFHVDRRPGFDLRGDRVH